MADAEDLKSGQATGQRPAPKRSTAKIISVYTPCVHLPCAAQDGAPNYRANRHRPTHPERRRHKYRRAMRVMPSVAAQGSSGRTITLQCRVGEPLIRLPTGLLYKEDPQSSESSRCGRSHQKR